MPDALHRWFMVQAHTSGAAGVYTTVSCDRTLLCARKSKEWPVHQHRFSVMSDPPGNNHVRPCNFKIQFSNAGNNKYMMATKKPAAGGQVLSTTERLPVFLLVQLFITCIIKFNRSDYKCKFQPKKTGSGAGELLHSLLFHTQ